MNSSDSARFERAYATIWMALHRGDEPDLSQHERQLLHHVPARGSVELNHIALHLALPKSTASALVKDLERRGFVTRRRDPRDERRLAITLTSKGLERVAADSVLDLGGLQAALAELSRGERQALLTAIEKLAASARAQREDTQAGERQSPYSPVNFSRT